MSSITKKWIGCATGNFAVGRLGFKPLAIVIHLMEGTLAGTDSWFLTPVAKRGPGGVASSAHYGIGKDGTVHQYVQETDRAYHAGRVQKPTWPWMATLPPKTRANPNNFTIGIEHEGFDDGVAWPDAMYQASGALISEIAARWGIAVDRDHIVGHRQIFAGKTCPGAACDLDRLIAVAREVTGGGEVVS